jgi:hypothetical protein
MAEIIFRYFKSVEGRVVPRYGTTTFIGVQRDQKVGWVWDTSAITRVPEYETTRYGKEYRRALSDGSMVECSKADFDALEQGVSVVSESSNVPEEVTETVHRSSRRQKEEK